MTYSLKCNDGDDYAEVHTVYIPPPTGTIEKSNKGSSRGGQRQDKRLAGLVKYDKYTCKK